MVGNVLKQLIVVLKRPERFFKTTNSYFWTPWKISEFETWWMRVTARTRNVRQTTPRLAEEIAVKQVSYMTMYCRKYICAREQLSCYITTRFLVLQMGLSMFLVFGFFFTCGIFILTSSKYFTFIKELNQNRGHLWLNNFAGMLQSHKKQIFWWLNNNVMNLYEL